MESESEDNNTTPQRIVFHNYEYRLKSSYCQKKTKLLTHCYVCCDTKKCQDVFIRITNENLQILINYPYDQFYLISRSKKKHECEGLTGKY